MENIYKNYAIICLLIIHGNEINNTMNSTKNKEEKIYKLVKYCYKVLCFQIFFITALLLLLIKNNNNKQLILYIIIVKIYIIW